jgi:hypothetical protein
MTSKGDLAKKSVEPKKSGKQESVKPDKLEIGTKLQSPEKKLTSPKEGLDMKSKKINNSEKPDNDNQANVKNAKPGKINVSEMPDIQSAKTTSRGGGSGSVKLSALVNDMNEGKRGMETIGKKGNGKSEYFDKPVKGRGKEPSIDFKGEISSINPAENLGSLNDSPRNHDDSDDLIFAKLNGRKSDKSTKSKSIDKNKAVDKGSSKDNSKDMMETAKFAQSLKSKKDEIMKQLSGKKKLLVGADKETEESPAMTKTSVKGSKASPTSKFSTKEGPASSSLSKKASFELPNANAEKIKAKEKGASPERGSTAPAGNAKEAGGKKALGRFASPDPSRDKKKVDAEMPSSSKIYKPKDQREQAPEPVVSPRKDLNSAKSPKGKATSKDIPVPKEEPKSKDTKSKAANNEKAERPQTSRVASKTNNNDNYEEGPVSKKKGVSNSEVPDKLKNKKAGAEEVKQEKGTRQKSKEKIESPKKDGKDLKAINDKNTRASTTGLNSRQGTQEDIRPRSKSREKKEQQLETAQSISPRNRRTNTMDTNKAKSPPAKLIDNHDDIAMIKKNSKKQKVNEELVNHKQDDSRKKGALKDFDDLPTLGGKSKRKGNDDYNGTENGAKSAKKKSPARERKYSEENPSPRRAKSNERGARSHQEINEPDVFDDRVVDQMLEGLNEFDKRMKIWDINKQRKLILAEKGIHEKEEAECTFEPHFCTRRKERHLSPNDFYKMNIEWHEGAKSHAKQRYDLSLKETLEKTMTKKKSNSRMKSSFTQPAATFFEKKSNLVSSEKPLAVELDKIKKRNGLDYDGFIKSSRAPTLESPGQTSRYFKSGDKLLQTNQSTDTWNVKI